MITIKLYLDARKKTKSEKYLVKLKITHNRKAAMINTGVQIGVKEWDADKGLVIGHPRRVQLNTALSRQVLEAEQLVYELQSAGKMRNFTALDVKREIERLKSGIIKNGSFYDQFEAFLKLKEGRTKELYEATLNRIKEFSTNAESLAFEDITKEWLTLFDQHLSKKSPSPNARAIHMRNIRAVFNEAIDNEATTFYPFRKFKIKTVETVKRSMSLDQLRKLFTCEVEPHEERYRDMFKLIFFLIGINIGDLCELKQIKDGRIEFLRKKTKRLYSIKVEREALELIEKLRGKDYLLFVLDDYKQYKDFAKRMNDNLQLIGDVALTPTVIGGKNRMIKTKEPYFPGITTYWARHTWATIAGKLDIPKETIAAALGHGKTTTTDIYIDFNRDKIDEANRRVIDYVTEISH